MRPGRVLARLVSWFLLLLAGLTADLTGLAEVITRAPVIFPSDAALRIQLPEWLPRERGQRDVAQWSHKKTKQIGARREIEVLDKCPEFQLVVPCQCRERKSGLDITCENVETGQLRTVTDNMKKYKQRQDFTIGFFKVRSSQLRSLPDYIFMGLKIVHLMLFDCALHTLMPNSLSALAGSLKHLVLSNNALDEVPSFALRQLRELDHINLNQNNISIIKDGAFWGLSKVTRLSLYDNQISEIYPDAFDGLTKWTGRILGRNDTKEVNTCDSDDFDPEFCESRGDLLRLNVGRNHLSEIPSQSLLTLKNLNHLDLSTNKIYELKGRPFEGLEKLDKLELNQNKIEELTDFCFEGLPKLTSLSIDYNKIYVVEPRAFSGLDDQLQTLSMAANKLSGVPQDSLRPLHQLITLHLNDNNLTRLDADTFEEFGEHIQNLWLQNNKISEIDMECFQELATLEWLKINNNLLRSLPYTLMEPVLGTLKYIDVYKNPLVCDCEMRWYKNWYLRINDTDHMKDITCRTEENTDVLMKDTDLEDMYCEAAPMEAEEHPLTSSGCSCLSISCLLLLVSVWWVQSLALGKIEEIK